MVQFLLLDRVSGAGALGLGVASIDCKYAGDFLRYHVVLQCCLLHFVVVCVFNSCRHELLRVLLQE